MQDVTAKLSPGYAVIRIEGAKLDSTNIQIRGTSAAGKRWRAIKRKEERDNAAMFCRLYIGARVALPVIVTLVRVSPRPYDDDNIRGAFKAWRDGVSDWLKVPDNDPNVTWEYLQVRGHPKQYAVEIRVQDVKVKS